jgi:hypothetical protein|tara:strand:+ start:1603 stop:1803 length:201 start_codon:yes stop_codon:yes gene_type:complete
MNEEKIIKFLKNNHDVWKRVATMYYVLQRKKLKELEKELGEENFLSWYSSRLLAETWRINNQKSED